MNTEPEDLPEDIEPEEEPQSLTLRDGTPVDLAAAWVVPVEVA